MKIPSEGFRLREYLVFGIIMFGAMMLCISAGSVGVSLSDTFNTIYRAIAGLPLSEDLSNTIILTVRLPRVICVALVGASLSLCGGAMQGLLRNPLADGSTLGVSSGASLGAALAIAFSVVIPGVPIAGTMAMAMLFAFLSLLLILSLAYKLDYSLSTNTIVLIGIVFTMFANSIISLIIFLSRARRSGL